MTVRSDRRYRFDVSREILWTALTRVDRYPSWWPWLRRFDGQAFSAGERWRCVVSPPLPYTLQFELVLEQVVEGVSATARLDGDIAGTAHLTVRDTGRGCELRLVSDLAAERGLVRLVDRVAPRLVVRGHDWVIDDGIRQFRTYAVPGSCPA